MGGVTRILPSPDKSNKVRVNSHVSKQAAYLHFDGNPKPGQGKVNHRVNFVNQKVSYKDKIEARKQIKRHMKRLKVIEAKNWLKSPVNKISLPTVEVLFGKKVSSNALIDSGSTVNLLNKHMLNKLIHNGIVKKVYTSNIECYGAGNNTLNIVGRCFVKINIGGFTWKVEVFVTKNLSWNLLLGIQFVKHSQLMLDVCEGEIYFKFKPTVKIPLHMKTCQSVNSVEIDSKIGIPEAVPKISELLERFSDVFTTKIGKALDVQYKIKLKEDTVINLRPYPISPPKVLRTQAIIDKLLEEDIIERSTSEYSSPIFLVTANNKDRLVVNFSKLNKILESTAYPIGDLHDCIHFLSGAKVFSVIDLSNSFYQIELTPESRKYTAFSTGYSLYNFKRIPYGLKVGSGILSKVMDDIFHDLKYKHCLNFIDDLICFSDDVESHIKLLETVFDRLKKHSLTVNPKKVKLAFTEIIFLGDIVSHNSCKIDPTRVEKVLNYPKPRNVKELATFIGMASYFSKHIEGYASKAACLNELRKKRSKFIWTKECEDSFNQLRLDLANPPILRLADFSKRFKLQTDASNKAVGACLLQEDEEGTYLPIAYYSRKFTPAEYKNV